MSPSGAPRRRSLWVGPQVLAGMLVFALVAALAINPTRQLIDQRRRVTEAAEALRTTRFQTEQLERRVARLKSPDFIEERARKDLGLIRPGEEAFIAGPRRNADAEALGEGARDGRRAETGSRGNLLDQFLTFIGVP